jgi:MFS family permease
VEKSKYNHRFILGITLVSAMACCLVQGWAMSSALIGYIVGSMFSGWLSDRYGRKLPLIAAVAMFTIAGTALFSLKKYMTAGKFNALVDLNFNQINSFIIK